MAYNIELYPGCIGSPSDWLLYYIEFTDWGEGDPVRWKLYKRNFLTIKECTGEMETEVHPYSLLEGTVLPDHCTPNKEWLKFMVDSLNEKVYNDAQNKNGHDY